MMQTTERMSIPIHLDLSISLASDLIIGLDLYFLSHFLLFFKAQTMRSGDNLVTADNKLFKKPRS